MLQREARVRVGKRRLWRIVDFGPICIEIGNRLIVDAELRLKRLFGPLITFSQLGSLLIIDCSLNKPSRVKPCPALSQHLRPQNTAFYNN